MKNFMCFAKIAALLFLCSLFTSCNKETENDATKQEVMFSFNLSYLKEASLLKGALANELSDVDKIVITIRNSDSSMTKYNTSEINIQQMNGIYYSQRITLKTGAYLLTEFDLIDHSGSTIFAVPLTGSLMSQNVSTALPIAFSVTKNAFTSVPLEVLSTESRTPEDFGLSRFPIADVKTFRFIIGVADAETDQLLASKLTVSSGTYSYVQNLDTITNNIVTVKDGLAGYTLTVEKEGYNTYSHTYSLDSLKMFRDTVGNLPLLIELEKLNLNFTDGFEEDSLNNYWTLFSGGQATISSEQSHTGFHSVKLTGVQGSLDATYISHNYSALMKGRISVWLYDTFAGQYGPYCKLDCYNTNIPSGTMGNVFAVGIDDWLTNRYSATSSIAGVNTDINRTVGWHKWEIYFGTSQVDIFIDNTLVYSVAGDYSFNKVELFAGYHNGSFYYDDFSVVPE